MLSDLKNDTKIVWNKIQSECNTAVKQEPTLKKFFYTNILKHNNLGNALNFILSHKLHNSLLPFSKIQKIIQNIYQCDPNIIYYSSQDILATYLKSSTLDNKYCSILLYFKGFHALQTYRLCHYLWNNNQKSLALYFQYLMSTSFDVDIHPAANIGFGILFDHATGIVIGETTIIENYVSILQSVTLGSTGKTIGDRHPKIRQGVFIGAGSNILGNIEIGKKSKIGAGSVVVHTVPPYTTVTGIPAKIIKYNPHE